MELEAITLTLYGCFSTVFQRDLVGANPEKNQKLRINDASSLAELRFSDFDRLFRLGNPLRSAPVLAIYRRGHKETR